MTLFMHITRWASLVEVLGNPEEDKEGGQMLFGKKGGTRGLDLLYISMHQL